MLDLYKNCYKLEGEPFRLSPDHRFSYLHRSYANAKAYLDYALSQGEGFIVITGVPGTGKTTLISDLIDGLDRSRILVATLTSAQLDLEHLIMLVISSFGLEVKGDSIALSLMELEQFLIQLHQRGERAILIVDEAQGLSSAALEELRLLSNLQHGNRLLLQIFLVGQEGLLEMIQMPGMEHFHQRLIAASSMEPLDLDETVSYLEYRLCQVGWQGDPSIDEEAIRIIHRYSSGIPRRINLISHRLFMYGGIQQKHAFTGEDARQVIEELRTEHLLAADVATEQFTEEYLAEEHGDSSDPARSLPRAESFDLARQHRQQSEAPEPVALAVNNLSADPGWSAVDQVSEETTVPAVSRPDSEGEEGAGKASETYTGNDKQSNAYRHPESGEGILPVGGGVLELETAGSVWHWVWAVVLALLAGLLFAVFVEKDFRDRLTGFMQQLTDRIEDRASRVPANPPNKVESPYDTDNAVRTMTPQPIRPSEPREPARELPAVPDAVKRETLNSTSIIMDKKTKSILRALPSEEGFTGSHTVNADKAASGNYPVNGTFSYAGGSGQKNSDLPDELVLVDNGNVAGDRADTEADTGIPDISSTAVATVDDMTGTTNVTVKTTGNAHETADEKVDAVVDVAVTAGDADYTLSSGGVVFRVQVWAASNPNSSHIAYFMRKHALTKSLYMETTGGWKKYSVGSFRNYEEASHYKQAVASGNGVSEPFVVAFKNGKRIPLQEAIDITR